MKKLLLLLFTLAIPVAIFLFLKIFGSNEFAVPYFYEKGIPGCEESAERHIVPEVNLLDPNGKEISSASANQFVIFGYIDQPGAVQEQVIQFVRIQDALLEVGPPRFVLISDDMSVLESFEKLADNSGLNSSNYDVGSLDSKSIDRFCKCGLGLKSSENRWASNLVLVDPNGNIRGMYNILEDEQTEKLILELKILIEQLG